MVNQIIDKYVALSYCFKCKVFFCGSENCTKEHESHTFQNLETIDFNILSPLIAKFNDNLEKMDGINDLMLNKQEIRNFKKNFDNFIQIEKSQMLKNIDEMKNYLTHVYNQYSGELQQLQSSTKNNLDYLDSKLKSNDQFVNLFGTLNKIIKDTNSQKSRKKDYFIMEIINNLAELNSIKFDEKPSPILNFNDTFNLIKSQCQIIFESMLDNKFIEDLKNTNLERINYFYTNIKKPFINNNHIKSNQINNVMSNDNSIKKIIRSSIGRKEKSVGIVYYNF